MISLSAEDRARAFLRTHGIEFQAPVVAQNLPDFSPPSEMLRKPLPGIVPAEDLSPKEKRELHDSKVQQAYLDDLAPTSTLSRNQRRELDEICRKDLNGTLTAKELARARKLVSLHDPRDDGKEAEKAAFLKSLEGA